MNDMSDNVRAFSSMEEAVEFMAQQEKIANANVLPMNREVDYGSYWWRYYQEYDLFIFGEVFPEDHTVTWWAKNGGDDLSDEAKQERDFEIERLADAHKRGYRYGRCYSVMEPEGELGSTHIVEMFPMSKTEFERAKADDWDVRDTETGTLRPWFAVVYMRTRERFLRETQ